MPDVAPLRLHISRRYGLSVPPSVPHGEWATCDGRSPGSRFERPFLTFPALQCGAPVAYAGETCRLQLREQPRLRLASHRVSIFIDCAHECAGETVTPLKRRSNGRVSIRKPSRFARSRPSILLSNTRLIDAGTHHGSAFSRAEPLTQRLPRTKYRHRLLGLRVMPMRIELPILGAGAPSSASHSALPGA